MKTFTLPISLLLALVLTGCEPSQTEKLYNIAVQKEQQPNGDHMYTTLEAYRQVIRTEPKSAWAEKAQTRIDVIQRNIGADNAASETRRTRDAIEFNKLLK